MVNPQDEEFRRVFGEFISSLESLDPNEKNLFTRMDLIAKAGNVIQLAEKSQGVPKGLLVDLTVDQAGALVMCACAGAIASLVKG